MKEGLALPAGLRAPSLASVLALLMVSAGAHAAPGSQSLASSEAAVGSSQRASASRVQGVAQEKPPRSSSEPTVPKPSKPASTAPKPLIYDLEEIVVTGLLAPLRVQQAPVPVQVVDRRVIEGRRPLDAAEALTSLSGVEVLRSGPLGSLTSLQVRGSSSNDVLVLQDGRPLNHPSVGGADLSLVPIELVDRIEVVRGPFSVLYGGNAMSGVVQLFTKRPSKSDRSSLTLWGGSMGTSDLSASLVVPLGERARLLVVPTLRATQGNRPNSDARLGSGFFRLDAETGGRGLLTLTGGLNAQRLGVPGPQPTEAQAKRTLTQRILGSDLVSSTYDRLRNQESYLQAQWTDERLTARAWHNAWTSSFRGAYYLDPLLLPSTYESNVREYLTGIEARYRIPHLERSALTLGGLYERAFEDSSTDYNGLDATTFAVLERPLNVRYLGRRDTRAWYLEESLVLDRFSASCGVRADLATGYAGQLSPRVNLLYRPTDALSLRLGWGRGYRAPTLDEQYYPSDGYFAGNPGLRPQRSTTLEAGADVLLSPGALLRATWFADEVRDQIATAPTGPPGLAGPVYQPSNLSRLSKRGLEASLTWKPSSDWTLSSTWTHLRATQTRAEVTDAFLSTLAQVEREAANIPRNRVTLSATYRSPQGFWAQADARLVGERQQYFASYAAYPAVTYETRRLPANGVVDLTLGQRFRSGERSTDVFLKVTNLLDERYSMMFGSDVADRGYPMPRRALFLGVRQEL